MKYKVLRRPDYVLQKLRISTIDDQYIQLIREWRNNQINILRQDKLISKDQQIDYFNKKVFSLYESDLPEQILFNCFYEDQFIGYGGIVHISYEHKIGEISFLLNPSILPGEYYESIFHLFLTLMNHIAFEELSLNKLFTETFSSRMEHVPMLEKAGYEREGVRRSHLIINGKTADIYLHGKLSTSLKSL